MSIIENNKLLAEFMGFKVPTTEDGLYWKDIKRKGTPILDMATGRRSHTTIDDRVLFDDDELMFHKSLDWLIPVVKEIHGIEQAFLYADTDVVDDLQDALTSLDRDSIYKAAVEVVKYYNENK